MNRTKHEVQQIIERELKAAARRWGVKPEDIITKRDKHHKCSQVPEYCARYEVILSLRDQWFSNQTLAKLFQYKHSNSISQLIKKFELQKQ